MITIAGGVIRDDEGRMLLVHRCVKRVQWELPGGKVENGETTEQAVVREIEEELGVHSQIVSKIGQKQFSEGEREFMHIWFELEIVGEPKANEDIFDEVRYFSTQQIEEMLDDCSAGVKSFLNPV